MSKPVADAAVIMATEANKNILRDAGLLTPEAQAASPNDLVIAVSGETGSLEAALAHAEALLLKKSAAGPGASGGAAYPGFTGTFYYICGE